MPTANLIEDIVVNAGDVLRVILSGGDFWRNGVFAHGRPALVGNLDRELHVQLFGGRRYNSGALGDIQVTGSEMTAQLLPGWRFRSATASRLEACTPASTSSRPGRLWPIAIQQPSALEVRLGSQPRSDLWFEAHGHDHVRRRCLAVIDPHRPFGALHLGWRVLDAFYVGPETQLFASQGYRRLRFGAHITSMKTSVTGMVRRPAARRATPIGASAPICGLA